MPTARLGLPFPLGTQAADGPAQIKALADALDVSTPYAQGTLAARPAATMAGKLYYATDAALLSYANGSTWINLGPSVIADLGITNAKLANDSVTAAKIANDAVGSGEIAASAVGNSELAALAVDAGKIAASLKPSGTAAGATEALRALGTNAGRAAAGSHAAQHNVGGADIVDWSAGVLSTEVAQGTLAKESDFNVPTNTDKVVPFTLEFGSPGMSLSGGVMSVETGWAGWYRLSAQVTWESDASLKHVWIERQIGGAGSWITILRASEDMANNLQLRQTVAGTYYLAESDVLRLAVRQTSGITLAVQAAYADITSVVGFESPVLHAHYLGP